MVIKYDKSLETKDDSEQSLIVERVLINLNYKKKKYKTIINRRKKIAFQIAISTGKTNSQNVF